MSKTTGELRNDYQKIKEIVTHNPNITSKEFKKRLQEAGITDINCVYGRMGYKELSGYTLLHYSINFGDQKNSEEYKKIIELLIANNADINLQTISSCMSPLDLATSIDDVEVMRMILNTQQSTEQNKINALCFATIHGNLEAIDLLIDNGVNVNSLGTNERMSPLSFAIACPDKFGVSKNRLQVIQHLLSKGADLSTKNGRNPYTNERDEIGTIQYSEKSPLEIAREKGDQEIIQLLESSRSKEENVLHVDIVPHCSSTIAIPIVTEEAREAEVISEKKS